MGALGSPEYHSRAYWLESNRVELFVLNDQIQTMYHHHSIVTLVKFLEIKVIS